MQTVYVAGGAGFIGSHLCRELLQKEHQVICIDNFITSSSENVTDLLANPNFQLVEKDVSALSSQDFSELPKADFIFHLASPASPNAKSPRSYIAFGVETLQANSVGTKNLLDLSRDMQARFLYASTSEVYGDPAVSPQSEDYWGYVNPNGVRSVYDEGKRFGEAVTMEYFRKYGVDTRIVRIFNTYGPTMQVDDGRVVSNFIVAALKNEPITVFGDGSQTRSFCYVSDLVEGLMSFMFEEGLQGEVINIGNPGEKTILEFAQIIQQLTHTASEIVHEVLPLDDPKRRNPDITKAKKLLHWEPKVTLEDGLRKTIDYFTQVVK